MRPSALDHLGLGETLRGTVASWRERHPELDCDLHLSGDLDSLDEPVNITIYRVVQECLTNVVRHAQASRADVTVSREATGETGEAVVVTVDDNGRGFTQQQESDASRFGLIGMRERVQALGGSLEVSGDQGRGVRVRAVIPLSKALKKQRAGAH